MGETDHTEALRRVIGAGCSAALDIETGLGVGRHRPRDERVLGVAGDDLVGEDLDGRWHVPLGPLKALLAALDALPALPEDTDRGEGL